MVKGDVDDKAPRQRANESAAQFAARKVQLGKGTGKRGPAPVRGAGASRAGDRAASPGASQREMRNLRERMAVLEEFADENDKAIKRLPGDKVPPSQYQPWSNQRLIDMMDDPVALYDNAANVLAEAEMLEDMPELTMLYDEITRALLDPTMRSAADPTRIGQRAILSKAKSILADRVRRAYQVPFDDDITKPPKGMASWYPDNRTNSIRQMVPADQIGTAENIAQFGATAAKANLLQRAQRASHGYIGQGSYMTNNMDGRGPMYEGQGGFFGGLAGNLAGMIPGVSQVVGMAGVTPGQLGSHLEDAALAYRGRGGYWGRQVGKFIANTPIGRLRPPSWVPGAENFDAKTFWPRVASNFEDIAPEAYRLGRSQGLSALPQLARMAANTYRGSGAYEGGGGSPVMPFYFDDDAVFPGSDVDFVAIREQKKRNRAEAGLDPVDQFGGAPIPAEQDPTKPVLQTNQLINPDSLFARLPPQIASTTDELGYLRFRYREYLLDVVTTPLMQDMNKLYAIAVLELNAGLRSTFPLLAQFAALYGTYKFNSLVFRYRTNITSGNSVAAGNILIVPIYNPHESIPATKKTAENTAGAATGKITDRIDCGIECDTRKTAHSPYSYIRTGPVADVTAFDIGRLGVFTQGVPENLNCGELWVEYEAVLGDLNGQVQAPLEIGQGVSCTVVMPSPVFNIREVINRAVWMGVDSTTPTIGSAVVYPGKEWSAQKTASSSALQSPGLAVGALATNPGVYNQLTSAALSFDQGIYLGGFTMAPNLTCFRTTLSNGPDNIQSLTIAFTAIMDAVYQFSMCFVNKGPTSADGIEPSTIITESAGDSAGNGTLTTIVEGGNIKIAEANGKVGNFSFGIAYANSQPANPAFSISSNVISVGCILRSAGQGDAVVTFQLDGSQFTTGWATQVVSTCFVRIA